VEDRQRESCVTFLHTAKWYMATVCGQTAQQLNLVLKFKSPEIHKWSYLALALSNSCCCWVHTNSVEQNPWTAYSYSAGEEILLL